MTQYWDQFQAAYQAAPQDKKDLIDSESIPQCVTKSLELVGSSAERRQVVVATSLLTLNAIDPQEASTMLQKAGVTDPQTFLKAFSECLGTKAEEVPDLASEIQSIEQEMGSLHTVRTMAEDVAAASKTGEVVHQSNQENIFAKEPDDNTPRWGSET